MQYNVANMTLAGVDLNLLVPLDALIAESSVSKAAIRVGLSTPAMSHALSRLRVQLNDPVLVRAGRSMVRTPLAEQLQPKLQKLLDDIGAVLLPSPQQDPAQLTNRFRVRATDHVLAVIGTEIDRVCRSEAPNVQLVFTPNQPSDADGLRAAEVDVAIGVYNELPPELRVRKLFEDRFVCVLRKGHKALKKKLTLQRYAALQHVVVAPRGRPGSVIDARLSEIGKQRHVARIVPYFLAALGLVAEGDYVLTVSERLAKIMAERFGLVTRRLPLEISSYRLDLVWHPRHQVDFAHRWFRGALVRAAEVAAPPMSS